MAVRISSSMSAAYEFACHSAACRPPTSGGTGGSSGGPRHADVSARVVQIKGNAVHLDGKKVTGSITKSGGQYRANVLGTKGTSVLGHTTHDVVYGATKERLLRNAEAYFQNKAAARKEFESKSGRNMSDTEFRRTSKWTPGARERIASLGATKASKVAIGRDGVVKVNGKEAGNYAVRRNSNGKWVSDAFTTRSGKYTRPKEFKTQSALKLAIARDVNAVVARSQDVSG